jgi:hypothetical protein
MQRGLTYHEYMREKDWKGKALVDERIAKGEPRILSTYTGAIQARST